ncbi:MAG TPA: GNAT family N-acetyltransferase [Blastocatellia bacterium]|nr:GNAT family N-acetyltransferase [Blastocatellia bacterium]
MLSEVGTTIEVTRTYLEIHSPADFKPAFIDDPRVRIEHLANCPPSFFRYLYREVGRAYHWVDRLSWTDEVIRAYLATPGVTLWVMYCDGAPAGYFELAKGDDDSTEIAYFGLLPEFIGRGLGKYLLSFAVERAFADGARRVWLHTCTLDDPAAMPNYLKRGFKPFKEERYVATIAPEEVLRALPPE